MMYNKNSILFQQAVSEGRISSETIAELEKNGLLINGPGPRVEVSLEEKLAGLECPEEDDELFTDIHGRTLLEQYPPDAAAQQPINFMQPGDKAKLAMNMRAQTFSNNQNPVFGSTTGFMPNPNYGCNPQMLNGYNAQQYNNIMPNTLYISYDDVYGENRYNNNPYAKYMNMYRNNQFNQGMSFNPTDIGMVSKENNDKYVFKAMTKKEDEHILPFSDNFNDKCEEIKKIGESVQTTYINPFVGSAPSNPGFNSVMNGPGYPSMFNGYQMGFMANYQKSIMEQQNQNINNQLGIIKKICKCTSVYSGTETLTDDQIKNRVIPNYESQSVSTPTIDNNPIKPVIVTYDENGNIIDEVTPNANNKYVYNRESEQQNFNRMAMWQFNNIPFNVPIQNSIIAYNKKYDEIKSKYPDSMGLVDFLNNAGPLYNDMLMRNAYREYGHYAVNLVEAVKFNKDIAKDKALYDQECSNNQPPDYHLRDMSGQFNGMFKNDDEYTKYTGISFDDKNGVLNIKAPDHIRSQHPEMLSPDERQLYEGNQDVLRRLKIQSSSLYEQRTKAFYDFIASQKATASDKRRGD